MFILDIVFGSGRQIDLYLPSDKALAYVAKLSSCRHEIQVWTLVSSTCQLCELSKLSHPRLFSLQLLHMSLPARRNLFIHLPRH